MASAATVFKQQVIEEFKKEFNIVWTPGDIKCTISHKNNPDDFLACCAPGCFQQYVYTLTLLDGGKVEMVDDIAGSFNRAQGNMAAGNGNATQVVGVANMTNRVMQKVSRIENQLMIHLNNMRLQSNVLPAVAVVAVPETQKIVRDIEPESTSDKQRDKSIADEITKLKELHSTGVLSDEEFQQAKASALASFGK
eukprot:CAMPEP_0181119742 /NCGR_PEP_ID=MMETSP1071-20121207/23763_1 /TAXON_ID=35127 /ORGANISM="Thalassiosira sp., Strain NH16" /LENGTH=194 /DNA_ID=CAMNT_0023204307 /DNA_START=282 /DNA_END=866 /DNA_ORIENTATION=+